MKNPLALVVNREGEIWSPQGLVGHADSKSELEYLNSIGVDQSITTLTSILPTIIDTKYYQLPLADFVNISVGQGNPFVSTLYNWSTQIVGGGFESGNIDMASNKANTESDSIVLEPITRDVMSWKKDVNYNIFQEKTFSQGTQNMDFIAELYKGRKKEYDLGIQELLFFGLQTNTKYKGLLTLSGVTANTALITKKLSDMTTAEFAAFIGSLLSVYQTNNDYTAMPNRFVIPADDYVGLTKFTSEIYPVAGSTRLEVLTNCIKTFAPDFKVLGSAYNIKAKNAAVSGLNKNRYVLYNNASDTIAMDIPVDFTVTLPGTTNGFDYTSAAYSRYTGLTAFRPLEVMYFDFG